MLDGLGALDALPTRFYFPAGGSLSKSWVAETRYLANTRSPCSSTGISVPKRCSRSG